MNQFNIALGTFIIYLILCFIRADDSCDKSKCPGPLQYYKDIGCNPIYEKPDDCCAYKYNCDQLKSQSSDKCYANDNTYDIGEKLKEEDANPCDIACMCLRGYDGIGRFMCATVDCFHGPNKPGCYRQNSPYNCCPGEEICPENPDDRATCVVDGKTYRDGEHFTPESESNKSCVCAPGYSGENIAPFCRNETSYCRPLFKDPSSVKMKCAPVYFSNQSPQSSCSVFSRCQNDLDKVIKNNETTTTGTDNDVCEFGLLTMHLGDELNQATDYSSVCVKCVCEVPPVPTCQRLPDEECDVTKVMFNRIASIGSAVKKRITEG